MNPNWEGKISNELRHEFKEIGEEAAGIARALVPVRTGELQKSISSKVHQPAGKIWVEVTADAPHAAYVEYGTGRRGRMTQNMAIGATISEMRELGRPAFSYGARPGMVAQPYLRPALIYILKTRFRMG